MAGPRVRLFLLTVLVLGTPLACSTGPCTDCDALHLRVQGTVQDSAGAKAPGLHVLALLTRYDTLVPTVVITSGTTATAANGTYDIVLTTRESDLALDSRPLLVRVNLRQDAADLTPLETNALWPVMPGPVSAAPPTITMDFVVPVP